MPKIVSARQMAAMPLPALTAEYSVVALSELET
jgi:hypothetical protein